MAPAVNKSKSSTVGKKPITRTRGLQRWVYLSQSSKRNAALPKSSVSRVRKIENVRCWNILEPIFQSKNKNFGSSIAQWLANFLLGPAAIGLIPSIPEIFSQETIVDVAEVNQLRGKWTVA